jgi:hypothetical protein
MPATGKFTVLKYNYRTRSGIKLQSYEHVGNYRILRRILYHRNSVIRRPSTVNYRTIIYSRRLSRQFRRNDVQIRYPWRV